MNVATTQPAESVAPTRRAAPFPTAKVGRTALAWVVAFIFFFPVLWMVLEGFKQETQAASIPPTIFFTGRPNLANRIAAWSAPLQCGPAQYTTNSLSGG